MRDGTTRVPREAWHPFFLFTRAHDGVDYCVRTGGDGRDSRSLVAMVAGTIITSSTRTTRGMLLGVDGEGPLSVPSSVE